MGCRNRKSSGKIQKEDPNLGTTKDNISRVIYVRGKKEFRKRTFLVRGDRKKGVV